METTTRRWPAVMVDLETLGTTAKAAVIEIGAVCFDLETLELGPTFERKVCLLANERSGRTIEAETLDWWMGRWRESGRVPRLLEGDTVEGAYWAFLEFWADHAAENAEFWSRGSFDEVILRDMGEAMGTPPWKFWNVRDQRTVCAWAGVPKAADVAHSALEDATDQVLALFQARTGNSDDEGGPAVSATDFQIPAEFYGGPFCGRKLAIPEVPPPGRTYIARSVTGDAYAYESAERTTPGGRWVLRFRCWVGGPLPAPKPETERGDG